MQIDHSTDDKKVKRGVFARIRGNFLAGLIIVAPIGLTFWLIWTVVGWVDGWVWPFIPRDFHPEEMINHYFGTEGAPPGAENPLFNAVRLRSPHRGEAASRRPSPTPHDGRSTRGAAALDRSDRPCSPAGCRPSQHRASTRRRENFRSFRRSIGCHDQRTGIGPGPIRRP